MIGSLVRANIWVLGSDDLGPRLGALCTDEDI